MDLSPVITPSSSSSISSALSSALPVSIHATNSTPEPPLTITRTFFKTSTLPPVFATHPFSSFSTPSFLTIPYTDTTITTQITLTTTTVPTSTSIDIFPHDDDGAWHHLFPALIFFALIGMLATLTFLVLFVFCLHRRRTRRREPQDEGGEKQPPTVRHTPDRLAISDNNSRPWKETGSPTFVPIETSPLTLVSRSAIWQDPARRRGVNELDLWERKQLHQQPPYEEETPTTLSFTPSAPQEDEEDEEDEEDGSFDADDRPWQKYMHQRSPPPLSDLAQAITLAALDEDDQQSIRSLNTTRETLRPLSYIHQDMPTNNELQSSGSSQWLCPPNVLE